MSSRWLIVPLLVLSLSNSTFSQKLINGFTRELAFKLITTPFSIKSFDVNNDTVPEIIATPSRELLIFDGKTFNPLLLDDFAPGTANLSQADVDRDGIFDLVATNGASSVIVWYGPDFLKRRVYTAPVGSPLFAVRNLEDGQPEFTFGFSDVSYSCLGIGSTSVTTGHLTKYIDTVFSGPSTIALGYAPRFLLWRNISPGQSTLLLAGHYEYNSCSPCGSFQCYTNWQSWIGGSVFWFGSYNWNAPAAVYEWVLQNYQTGNLDADSARESVEYITPKSWGFFPSSVFRAKDLLTDSIQWSRDATGFRFISTVDLDRDGVDELLAYKVLSGQPVLYEFQVFDGDTLGFTPLPFRADTMVFGLFGQPPKPKVLLAHADSIVVFGIDAPCAVARGDMNADGIVTLPDVILELDCVFLGTGNCELCFADVNCDGVLSAADVVWGLMAVFQQRSFPCL
ncbi:MAG: hypothetical protein L0196_02720 [candidate division Zixibacteria bacterium]|nr:hypothetical protein [candidate division Zixibacteria bacterium]